MLTHNLKFTPRFALGLSTLLLALSPLAAKALQTTDPFPGTTWKLVVPNWQAGPRGGIDAPTLKFNGGRAIASAGCNTMSGSYTVKDETLKVGAFLSTKMSCGREVDAVERRYAEALSSATKWQLSRDKSVLLIQNGKEPLVFMRQPTAMLKKTVSKIELP